MAPPEWDRLKVLMNHVRHGRAGCATLTNYTASRRAVKVFLRVYPLFTDGELTHFLGVIEPVGAAEEGEGGAWAAAGGAAAPGGRGGKATTGPRGRGAGPAPATAEPFLDAEADAEEAGLVTQLPGWRKAAALGTSSR